MLLLTHRVPKRRITILIDDGFLNRYFQFQSLGRRPLLLAYNAGYLVYQILASQMLTPSCRNDYENKKDLSYLVELDRLFEVMKQGPQRPGDFYGIEWLVDWVKGSSDLHGYGRRVFDIRDVEAALYYAKTDPNWRRVGINDAIGGRSNHDPRIIAKNNADLALAKFVHQACEDERRRDSLALAREEVRAALPVDPGQAGDHPGGAEGQEERATPLDDVGGTAQGGATPEPAGKFSSPVQLADTGHLPGGQAPDVFPAGNAQPPSPPESVAGALGRFLRDPRGGNAGQIAEAQAAARPSLKTVMWAERYGTKAIGLSPIKNMTVSDRLTLQDEVERCLQRENDEMLHHLKLYSDMAPGWGMSPLTAKQLEEAAAKFKRDGAQFVGRQQRTMRSSVPNFQQLPKDKPLSPEVANELRIERERLSRISHFYDTEFGVRPDEMAWRHEWSGNVYQQLLQGDDSMNRYEYDPFWLNEPLRIPTIKVSWLWGFKSAEVFVRDVSLSGLPPVVDVNPWPITRANPNKDPVTFGDRRFVVLYLYKPTRRNGVMYEMLEHTPLVNRETRLSVCAWDEKVGNHCLYNGILTQAQIDDHGCYDMMQDLRYKVLAESGKPHDEAAFVGAVLMETFRDSKSPSGMRYMAEVVDKKTRTVFSGDAEMAQDLQIDLQAQVNKLYRD